MALPLVPILLISGLTGASGFVAGGSLSDKLGTGITMAGIVVGLFLIFILAQRFGLKIGK